MWPDNRSSTPAPPMAATRTAGSEWLGSAMSFLEHAWGLRHPLSAWVRTHASMGTWFQGLTALFVSLVALFLTWRQGRIQLRITRDSRERERAQSEAEAQIVAAALLRPL